VSRSRRGILAGGSSGCVTAGIAQLLPQLRGLRIATVFPGSGAFYLSKYFCRAAPTRVTFPSTISGWHIDRTQLGNGLLRLVPGFAT
jgi:hypothetical protein